MIEPQGLVALNRRDGAECKEIGGFLDKFAQKQWAAEKIQHQTIFQDPEIFFIELAGWNG